MKIVRTHDAFYEKIDPKSPPKEVFLQIANLIDDYKNKILDSITIVDFGCASGAFVNYLSSRYPNDNIIGYELLKTLSQIGEKKLPKH